MGLLLALLLTFTFGAKPVELTVYHGLMAPSDVRMIVRIDPHPDNRALILAIDGPSYQASYITLEGEYAPKILERWFKGVRAPGQYVVVAVIRRAGDKEERAIYRFCLRGGDETCEPGGPGQ